MWTLQLATRQGAPLGELRNASNRSLRFPLNRTPTIAFTIDAAHPLARLFLDTDKLLVKAYDDSTGTKALRFLGPVVGYQKTRNAQGGTISVTAAGVQWRLDHRLVGKSDTGATFGTTPLSLLDRGEIMGRAIDALNMGEASSMFTDGGDTGIRRGTITASSDTYITGWRYKLAGEAFSELAGTLDGPDWEVAPVEPVVDAVGVQLGALNVAYAIGTIKPDVAFEFGTGRLNVADWSDVGDASTLANRASSLPSGFPDNAADQPITADDATAIADRGLYETVVPGDLQTQQLRLSLVQDHVRVRKTPRRVISFAPIAEDASLPIEQRRVPRLFADYIVGDTITFRAIERFPVFDSAGTVTGFVEVPTVDALMRIFAADITLDDGGTASTALTLLGDI